MSVFIIIEKKDSSDVEMGTQIHVKDLRTAKQTATNRRKHPYSTLYIEDDKGRLICYKKFNDVKWRECNV